MNLSAENFFRTMLSSNVLPKISMESREKLYKFLENPKSGLLVVAAKELGFKITEVANSPETQKLALQELIEKFELNADSIGSFTFDYTNPFEQLYKHVLTSGEVQTVVDEILRIEQENGLEINNYKVLGDAGFSIHY